MATMIPPPTREPNYGYTGREVWEILGRDRATAVRFAGAVRDWCDRHGDDRLKGYAAGMMAFADEALGWDEMAKALLADAVIKIPLDAQRDFLSRFLNP